MTNGRTSRRSKNKISRLIAQRNALLDTLNGVMNMGIAVNGKAEMLIPTEYMIGQRRFVIELVNTPEGALLKQRRDLIYDDDAQTEANALLVMPNPDMFPV